MSKPSFRVHNCHHPWPHRDSQLQGAAWVLWRHLPSPSPSGSRSDVSTWQGSVHTKPASAGPGCHPLSFSLTKGSVPIIKARLGYGGSLTRGRHQGAPSFPNTGCLSHQVTNCLSLEARVPRRSRCRQTCLSLCQCDLQVWSLGNQRAAKPRDVELLALLWDHACSSG